MTIALYAEFTATPGNGVTVRDLIAGFAQAVRLEPGNLRFDAHQLAEHPDTTFVYELYRDQDSFDAHLASEHGRVFNLELGPLVTGGGSRLTMLRPIEIVPA